MSLTAARRATLAALADSLLPHGGALEPGAADVDVAGQLDSYLDRCAPGTRRTVNLMLTAFNLSSIASRHARPSACWEHARARPTCWDARSRRFASAAKRSSRSRR